MPDPSKANLANKPSSTLAVTAEPFILLCAKAHINRRMVNAMRMSLGLSRKQMNEPVDPTVFNAVLAGLRPPEPDDENGGNGGNGGTDPPTNGGEPVDPEENGNGENGNGNGVDETRAH